MQEEEAFETRERDHARVARSRRAVHVSLVRFASASFWFQCLHVCTSKRERKTISFDDKAAIIRAVAAGTKRSQVAKDFDIAPSTLFTVVSRGESLCSYVSADADVVTTEEPEELSDNGIVLAVTGTDKTSNDAILCVARTDVVASAGRGLLHRYFVEHEDCEDGLGYSCCGEGYPSSKKDATAKHHGLFCSKACMKG